MRSATSAAASLRLVVREYIGHVVSLPHHEMTSAPCFPTERDPPHASWSTLLLPGPQRHRPPARSPARSGASPASPGRTALAIAVFLAPRSSSTPSPARPRPLIYRASSTRASPQERTGLVVGLAALVAVLAVVSAAIGLAQRWFSARIGEGLIHDLRTQVFDHVQRMPIGFFSRAQTGALVSRLNSDVQGAQQAFTSTLSNVVGNVVAVVATLAAMFVLSWQITLLALALLPLFVLPARWVGPAPRRHHPRAVPAQRRDGPDDDRALQRLGRPARQAVRPPGDRVGRVRRPRRPGPRHRRHARRCTPGS